jgi:hypothetical protein
MTNDAAGNVHYATGMTEAATEVGIESDYGPLDSVACSSQFGTLTFYGTDACDGGGTPGLQASRGGLFAFGPVAGDGIGFFLYQLLEGELSRARLGRLVGTKWKFADAPIMAETARGALAAYRIAVDKTGALLLLESDHVARRATNGTYDSVAFPSCIGPSAKVSDIKTDATGAWFIAATTAAGAIAVSRRDPSGHWVTESVDAAGTSAVELVLALGTLHLLYSRDDGWYYARRVGSGWVRKRIGTLSPALDLLNSPPPRMAIDSCGAPHLVWNSYSENSIGNLFWPVHYARWTRTGWRQIQVANGQDPSTPGIAMTPTAATVIAYEYNDRLFTFPFN